ncbi:hypothetical protein FY140_13710 [Agrobacterium tumefaciens]|uniref:hypothetical protein n=1 Tax=Agrobacterium tumefaciens TaxID=358 RepID=UPI0021D10A65|nr:hypothetical protein [Agrobacterium tumefaciens]UXT21814.1 hypothetical protein FY140_13710 [Agrobacterium tumefaciens]
MKILSLRRQNDGGNTLARFDLQLDGLCIYNIALKRTRSGMRVFAPSAFGAAVVTFTPENASAIVKAAMGEISDNENSIRAA